MPVYDEGALSAPLDSTILPAMISPDVFTTFAPAGSLNGIGPLMGQSPFQKMKWGLKGAGFGNNLDTYKLAFAGLDTLAGLWSANQQLGLAKKQLAFSKAFANANLANQTKSYNTAIADRARSRGAVEGQSPAQVEDYISKNSLANRTI